MTTANKKSRTKLARRFFAFAAAVFGLTFLLTAGSGGEAQAADKNKRIKFSTLAPEGSSWMKEMRQLAAEMKKKTGGRVSFKFYPGGVSGDERDVIRKMRIGQVHAAGFTGVGLGEILPEVRVLDLPFLFDSDAQILHVYEKMTDYFASRFEEKGYVLLGWVPVGWIHFFSKDEIRTVADLRKSRPWMWEGDPLVEETYNALEVRPVPLSITDVLLSLQTGMIDTVYASSQGALALQWFTKVKYMSRIRMGYATGGVLITKKKFDSLPSDQQALLKKLGKKHLNQLGDKIRQENESSIRVMQDNGVQPARLPGEDEIERFRKAGVLARGKLIGKLFPQSLLDKVLMHRREAK